MNNSFFENRDLREVFVAPALERQVIKKIKSDSKWPIWKIERKHCTKYYAVFSPKGSKQVTKTFKTKNEAILWLKQKYSHQDYKNNSVSFFEHQDKSIGWLCEYWLSKQSRNKLEESSLKKYKGIIDKHIIPHLRTVRFQELTHRKCEWWMEKISSNLSKISTNDSLRLLQKIYSDAVKHELISANPIIQVQRYKVEEKEFQFFTFEEKSIFLNYIGEKHSDLLPMFLTTLSTGMRLGELQGLLWDCVDFTTGQITIKRSFCNHTYTLKEHTKSKKIRRVPMNSQLKMCILELKNSTPNNSLKEYVFPEGRLKYKRACVWFKQICKKSGLPQIRFHDLRHTFASHFMMAGGGIYDLQKILGHSSIEMTERYSHLSPGHLNGVTEMLSMPLKKKKNIVNLFERK